MNKFETFAAGLANIDSKELEEFRAYQAAKVETVVETQEELATVETESGDVVYYEGDSVTVGSEIRMESAEGDLVGEGTWVLEDGVTIITDADSIVIEIVEAGAEDAPEEEAPAEDEEVEAAATAPEELLAILSEFDARLKVVEGKNADLTKVNEDLKAEAITKSDELSAEKTKVEKLSKVTPAEPNAANEAKASKTSTQSFSGKGSKMERLAATGKFK